jgi:predicted metal-binding membrane protein
MLAPAAVPAIRRHDRTILVATLLLLAVLAALAIALWQASPYGRYMGHEPTGLGLPLELSLFSAGWLLMIVAMMLPTTLPLLASFWALVSRRPQRRRLVVLVMLGYGATWLAFGAAAYAGDRGVHAVVGAVPLLSSYPQLIIGATLGLAGLWQFSPLKYRCLEECRSPLGFVLNRWRGVDPGREALRLGVAHGIFCIGCCWSLMLVMFGVGMGNLAWMLGLGGLMAVEKNTAWGPRIARPLGIALVLAALVAVSV